MADTLEIFGVEYTNVAGIIAKDDNGNDLTYTRGGGTPTLQTKSKTYTPTTSQQTESVTADSGYDGLDAVNITVNAMPSGTAGTPTATKGTVSNHQVSVTPSVTNTTGYITGSTKTGTAVTVSASELVSGSDTVTTNDTYDVTNLAELIVNVSGGTSWQTLYDGSAQVYSSSPNYFQILPYTTAFQSDQTYRVTWGQTQYLCNTIADPLGATYDGWLIGNLSIVGAGTDTGEPFIIYRNSATELTGGTTSSAGTASLKIELQQGGANLQNKTVTPTTSQQTVQADSGYDGLDTVTVNAMPTMTLPSSASSTSSGTSKATITPTSSAQYLNIPTGYNGTAQYYTIAASGGGTSKNVQVLQSTSRTNSSSLTKVNGDLTVSKTGTYDIYWSAGRSNTSSSYTWGSRLYVDGYGYSTENTTWTNNCQSNHLTNISLTANQKLSVYTRGRSGSYYTFAPMLIIIEA